MSYIQKVPGEINKLIAQYLTYKETALCRASYSSFRHDIPDPKTQYDSRERRIKRRKARREAAGRPATSIPLVIHAMNYNVLRIMNGMSGLSYSN